MNPPLENRNILRRKPLRHSNKGLDPSMDPSNLEMDPSDARQDVGEIDLDLERILIAWPHLPPAIRRAILAMLEAVATDC